MMSKRQNAILQSLKYYKSISKTIIQKLLMTHEWDTECYRALFHINLFERIETTANRKQFHFLMSKGIIKENQKVFFYVHMIMCPLFKEFIFLFLSFCNPWYKFPYSVSSVYLNKRSLVYSIRS